ncbi:hypothetical protein ACFL96_20180 [Thermoproteota archaeon]
MVYSIDVCFLGENSPKYQLARIDYLILTIIIDAQVKEEAIIIPGWASLSKASGL